MVRSQLSDLKSRNSVSPPLLVGLLSSPHLLCMSGYLRLPSRCCPLSSVCWCSLQHLCLTSSVCRAAAATLPPSPSQLLPPPPCLLLDVLVSAATGRPAAMSSNTSVLMAGNRRSKSATAPMLLLWLQKVPKGMARYYPIGAPCSHPNFELSNMKLQKHHARACYLLETSMAEYKSVATSLRSTRSHSRSFVRFIKDQLLL
jgi:hypothetical protein